MISKKVLAWLGAGLLSAVVVPATLARTHRHTSQSTPAAKVSTHATPTKTVSKTAVKKTSGKTPVHKSSRKLASHKPVSHSKPMSHTKPTKHTLASRKTTSGRVSKTSKTLAKPVAKFAK
jgi:hypothetical protein